MKLWQPWRPPAAASLLSVSAQAATCSRHGPAHVLIASLTGMLSTTAHVSPAASISALRRAISSSGQASPIGMWCSAVTTPRAPVWRTADSVIGSPGPNQRQDCSMARLHHRADLPGHEFVVAVAQLLGLGAFAGSDAQDLLEDLT